MKKIKAKIEQLKQRITQVYIALQDKRTPWYAKLMGWITVIYALSPIDLIPDFIPIIGYLDDLILLPIFITLTIKLIPKDVWLECEEKAKTIWVDGKPTKWYYALPIVFVWLLIIAFILVQFVL